MGKAVEQSELLIEESLSEDQDEEIDQDNASEEN